MFCTYFELQNIVLCIVLLWLTYQRRYWSFFFLTLKVIYLFVWRKQIYIMAQKHNNMNVNNVVSCKALILLDILKLIFNPKTKRFFLIIMCGFLQGKLNVLKCTCMSREDSGSGWGCNCAWAERLITCTSFPPAQIWDAVSLAHSNYYTHLQYYIFLWHVLLQ